MPEQESHSYLDNSEHPFKHLENSEGAVDIQDHLATLGLGFNSSAESVRRKAITLRGQHIQMGVPRDQTQSLTWALEQTGDCVNFTEFDSFYNRGRSLEEIRESRARRLDSNEKPFENLVGQDNSNMDSVYKSLNIIGKLSRFDLEYDCTVAEARFKARKAFRKFQIGNPESLQLLDDLRWLLKVTGDCQTDEGFLELVLNLDQLTGKLRL